VIRIGTDPAIFAAVRWEWRTFGDDLGEAAERLGSMPAESVAESDDTYLLSPEGIDAVKVRDGLMDLKHLEQVDENGLQLWQPVMKSPLPISAADAREVLAALRIEAPLDRDTYDLAELAAAAGDGLRVVPVHKRRRHVTIGGCMAELTDIRAGEPSTRTIAIESEDPARVIAAVRELGLGSRSNVSVPEGLKTLLG
jgi:exopolyphosphatase / guanosine-5'-triphosphate,3'-diphosphate pyrophosphatase